MQGCRAVRCSMADCLLHLLKISTAQPRQCLGAGELRLLAIPDDQESLLHAPCHPVHQSGLLCWPSA